MEHGPIGSRLLKGGVYQLRDEREESADSQGELVLDVAAGVDSKAEVQQESGTSMGQVLTIMEAL